MIAVIDHKIIGLLESDQIGFGLGVSFEIWIVVEMFGDNVLKDGDMRGLVEIEKLM